MKAERFDRNFEDEEGLPDEVVPANKRGLGAGVKVGVARDKDDWRVAVRISLMNFRAEFEPVHARHLNIQKDHVIPQPGGQSQGSLGVEELTRSLLRLEDVVVAVEEEPAWVGLQMKLSLGYPAGWRSAQITSYFSCFIGMKAD